MHEDEQMQGGVPSHSVRSALIAETLAFVREACQLPGVSRIALIGSLTTRKPDPKDADLLVTVADDMDLAGLATLARRLQGRAQSMNRGGEVFLANQRGRYLGRVCQWKECRPGIRLSCDAQHCGQRHYLHDDLRAVKLSEDLVDAPPIELWPKFVARVPVPEDIALGLVQPLSRQESRFPARED